MPAFFEVGYYNAVMSVLLVLTPEKELDPRLCPYAYGKNKKRPEEGLKVLEQMMCKIDKMPHSPSVNDIVRRRIR